MGFTSAQNEQNKTHEVGAAHHLKPERFTYFATLAMHSMLYFAICSGIALQTANFSFSRGARSRSSWRTENERKQQKVTKEKQKVHGGRRRKTNDALGTPSCSLVAEPLPAPYTQTSREHRGGAGSCIKRQQGRGEPRSLESAGTKIKLWKTLKSPLHWICYWN